MVLELGHIELESERGQILEVEGDVELELELVRAVEVQDWLDQQELMPDQALCSYSLTF